MRRAPRYNPEPDLPSTTRAVAWGAMFFAFLSFLMSSFTLLMTYRNGELFRNLKGSAEVIQQNLEKIRAEKARGGGGQGTAVVSRLRDQLARAEGMARQGDSQAKYYLEVIRADMEKLHELSSSQSAVWLGETMKKLDGVREQVNSNGPEAAQRLKAMAESLKNKVFVAGEGKSPSATNASGAPSDTQATPSEERIPSPGSRAGEEISDQAPPAELPNP